MNATLSNVYDLLENRLLTLVSTLGGVLSLPLVILDWVDVISMAAWQWVIAVACILAAAIWGAASIRLRLQVDGLRDCFTEFHAINHLYRDTLANCFMSENAGRSEVLWSQEESDTLHAVCQRIQRIFELLIRRPCVVTVKWMSDQHHAETLVRSVSKSKRDNADEMCLFKVGQGRNTALDEARDSGCSPARFCAPDLTKLKGYENQRRDWRSFYRSAIVVPIRCRRRESDTDGSDFAVDIIGFLCVDTMHSNHLKHEYQIEILASFADQMYNFISIMRQRYSLTPSGADRDP